MYKTITFDGITKPYLYLLRGSERPAWAPIENEIIEVPGMRGGYLSSVKTNIGVLNLVVGIKIPRFMTAEEVKEDMAAWLVTDTVKELIISDQPNRMYLAKIEGTFNPERMVSLGEGVLTFIYPDALKHGNQTTIPFTDIGTIHNAGTAPTYPKIKVEIKKDTTFVAVGNGEEINMIGNYGDVDETPYAHEERVFWDQMGTTVGWGATAVVEGGKIDGVLQSNGDSFLSRDYGTGANWHGPALKKAIGTTLQDFKLDALIRQIGSHGQVGSVEIMLLDVNNLVVAKLVMTKRSTHSSAVWARIRFGNEQNGHDLINSRGSADWVWQHFEGILRIERIGDMWTAYVSKYDAKTGWHSSLPSEPWRDSKGIATAPIAQVQVQLWQHGTTPTTTTQRIDDIKIYKINNVPNGIPYVARAGDIIEFDHETNKITRNGEDIKKEKAFIGEYFELKPGANTIISEPSDAIQKTTVGWRDKWR